MRFGMCHPLKKGGEKNKLPLKAPEERQEVIESLAATKAISVDAAAAAVFSKLEGIFTLKEEKKMALRVFLSGQFIL